LHLSCGNNFVYLEYMILRNFVYLKYTIFCKTMRPTTFEEFLWAMGEEQVADSIRSIDDCRVQQREVDQTYHWTPPSPWKTTGGLGFLLQTDQLEAIPLEVKSARNGREVRHLPPYAAFCIGSEAGGHLVQADP